MAPFKCTEATAFMQQWKRTDDSMHCLLFQSNHCIAKPVTTLSWWVVASLSLSLKPNNDRAFSIDETLETFVKIRIWRNRVEFLTVLKHKSHSWPVCWKILTEPRYRLSWDKKKDCLNCCLKPIVDQTWTSSLKAIVKQNIFVLIHELFNLSNWWS